MDTIGPLDSPYWRDPESYDVYVSDIKPSDLPTTLSRVLGTPYLSVSPQTSRWPIAGAVWGHNRRVLFTLPVSSGDLCVNVHFMFDTGAPFTYLSRSALEALGLEEWQLDHKPVRINGVTSPIAVSDSVKEGHFKGISLLGMDYVDRVNAILTIDMAESIAKVELHQNCTFMST